jgi:hypothetical protein
VLPNAGGMTRIAATVGRPTSGKLESVANTEQCFPVLKMATGRSITSLGGGLSSWKSVTCSREEAMALFLPTSPAIGGLRRASRRRHASLRIALVLRSSTNSSRLCCGSAIECRFHGFVLVRCTNTLLSLHHVLLPACACGQTMASRRKSPLHLTH